MPRTARTSSRLQHQRPPVAQYPAAFRKNFLARPAKLELLPRLAVTSHSQLPTRVLACAVRSIAIFCAALALTMGVEIVVFSQHPPPPPPTPPSPNPPPLLTRGHCSQAQRVAQVGSCWSGWCAPRAFALALPPLTAPRACKVEFIRVLDCDDRIVEYNQEACRVTSYNGKRSLIRSFPCVLSPSARPSATPLTVRALLSQEQSGGTLLTQTQTWAGGRGGRVPVRAAVSLQSLEPSNR